MKQPPTYRDTINKVPVRAVVQTTQQIFTGTLHIQAGFRLKDVINRPEEEFLAVTDAEFPDQGEPYKFLLLQKREVVWIAPIDVQDQLVEPDEGSAESTDQAE